MILDNSLIKHFSDYLRLELSSSARGMGDAFRMGVGREPRNGLDRVRAVA